jgi:D-arabinose 1-dehydrogenase-like Zn-dependent alcohol dehydrogenase
MEKNIRLQGSVVGSKEMFGNMLKAIEENKIDPIVDRTFSFEETPDAFRYLEDGKFFGKVCITIN